MSDFWGAITDIVLPASLLVAAVWAGWQAKKQADEMIRPHVVAELEPDPSNPKNVRFSVQNIGQGPAFDVDIKCNPPLEHSKELFMFPGVDSYDINELKMLREPIYRLISGEKLTTFYDKYEWRRKAQNSGADLPSSHEVTITCHNFRKKRYTVKSIIDFYKNKDNVIKGELLLHREKFDQKIKGDYGGQRWYLP